MTVHGANNAVLLIQQTIINYAKKIGKRAAQIKRAALLVESTVSAGITAVADAHCRQGVKLSSPNRVKRK